MRREPLVKSSESSGADEVEEKHRLGDAAARSLFWVLRRGEAVEEEAERREDEVEDSLDGWREETYDGAVVLRSPDGGFIMEVWDKSLFSRLGGE